MLLGTACGLVAGRAGARGQPAGAGLSDRRAAGGRRPGRHRRRGGAGHPGRRGARRRAQGGDSASGTGGSTRRRCAQARRRAGAARQGAGRRTAWREARRRRDRGRAGGQRSRPRAVSVEIDASSGHIPGSEVAHDAAGQHGHDPEQSVGTMRTQDDTPKVRVVVAVDKPAALDGLTSADVGAVHRNRTMRHVLAVPVGALLALGGGGYGVQIAGGALTAVEVGCSPTTWSRSPATGSPRA